MGMWGYTTLVVCYNRSLTVYLAFIWYLTGYTYILIIIDQQYVLVGCNGDAQQTETKSHTWG